MALQAEALTLSATLFHADVDAWLPSSFGVTRSPAEKAKEWDTALLGAQRDRLGCGHPDLNDPTARTRNNRAGIDVLEKLAKKKKVQQEIERSQEVVDGESRTAAVAKKKNKAVDRFGGKAAVHPLLNLKNPIPGYEPSGSETGGTKRARDDDDEKDTAEKDIDDKDIGEDGDGKDDIDEAAISKTQARREKRRRAKLRKAGKA